MDIETLESALERSEAQTQELFDKSIKLARTDDVDAWQESLVPLQKTSRLRDKLRLRVERKRRTLPSV